MILVSDNVLRMRIESQCITHHMKSSFIGYIVYCLMSDDVFTLRLRLAVISQLYLASCEIIAQMPTRSNKESYCVWANRGLEQG